MTTIETLRQFKMGEYAIFDIVVSFIGIYLLAPLLSKAFLKLGLVVPKISWMAFTLPLGILVHLIAGSFTPMTQHFMDPQGHYVLKVIIIGLTVFGLRQISVVGKTST